MARKPPQPLPRMLSVEEILPTATRMIESQRKLIEHIIQTVEIKDACFDNVLMPLVELENADSGEKAVISLLKNYSPSLEVQEASTKAEALWEEADLELRPDFVALVKAVKDRGENLHPEAQKLVDMKLVYFKGYGYGILDEDGIKRIRERRNKIEKLCAEFQQNLRNYEGGELFDPEELEGVPEKDRQPPNAEGKEYYSYQSKYFAIVRNASNPRTRMRMKVGDAKAYAENVPVFREILLLRAENAQELGLRSHAVAQLPYRTAESIEWVEGLLKSMEELVIPHGRASIKRITNMKRRYLKEHPEVEDDNPDTLMPWDSLYYDAMVQKQLNKVDNPAISEYYPLRHTIDKMLVIFSDCLQLTFERISDADKKDHVPHESIECWILWDEREESRGDFLGYLFIDPKSRPNKYKGNQSCHVQPGFVKPDGSRVYPANLFSCDFSNYTPTTDCLLSHGDVKSLFHELGHSIHDILARTKFSRYHGFEVTAEFGEGIGLMLERWCWLPDVMKDMSLHYTRVNEEYKEAWIKQHPGQDLPPEKIPESLIAPRLARYARWKLDMVRSTVLMSTYDLTIHHQPSREALLQLDEGKVYRELMLRLSSRMLPDESYDHLSFGHLTAGYDAGYYAYMCADVFAADMFQSVFSADPRSKEAWAHFRKCCLEPGASLNELDMLRSLLGGRLPDTKALISSLNVPIEE